MSHVFYSSLPTPIGKLTIGVSPWGIRWIVFAGAAAPLAVEATYDAGATRIFTEQIDEYFAGERKLFDFPVDWDSLPGGFTGEVLHAIAQIPYGQTQSYGTIANIAGSIHAARAVGQICKANHILLVVPCHRVIQASGSLGGFTGGTELKAQLLAAEGVILPMTDPL